MTTTVWLHLVLAGALCCQQGGGNQPAAVDEHGDPLPNQALARLGTVRFTPGSEVRGVAFSPDGKTIASTSSASIDFWETATGKRIRHVDERGNWWRSPDFSPDGKTLAVVTYYGMGIYEVASGKSLQSDSVYLKGGLVRLRYSPDGKYLAVGAAEGTVFTWDVAARKMVHKYEGHKGAISGLDWSPDGRHFASCGGGTVRLWEFATGKEVRQFYRDDDPLVGARTVVFGPDGGTLAASVGGKRGTGFLLWDVKTGRPLPLTQATPRQRNARDGEAVSPDGSRYARANENCVEVRDVKDDRLVFPASLQHKAVHAVAFAPDGKTLLAVEAGAARLWDVAGRKLRHSVPGNYASTFYRRTTAVAFRSDGSTALVMAHEGYSDHQVNEIDVSAGKCLGHVRPELGSHTNTDSCALTRDGKTLAWIDGSRLKLFETGKGKELQRWDESSDSTLLAFSADDKLLAVVCHSSAQDVHGATRWQTRIVFRDVAIGKEVRTVQLSREVGWVYVLQSLCLSPDGKTMAVGSKLGLVHLLDARTGAEQGRLAGHHGVVNGVAYRADGRLLASAAEDGTVLIWDMSKAPTGGKK
jgi:WD40 repeat protein